MNRRALLNLAVAATCLLAGSLALLAAPGYAQRQGFFVTPASNTTYKHIPQIEQDLYGHTYWNQSYVERVDRLEKTLFGARQNGPQQTRVDNIVARMREKSNAHFSQNQEPMLVYLEEKLFQRTYENAPLPVRVQQLESHVFGRSFDSYPLEVRLKKLAYAVPIVAKEIRVAKGDIVVASTAHKSPRVSPRTVPVQEISLIDASQDSRIMPVGMAPSTGDYFQSIHRQPGGQMVRWAKLPIKVYIKPTQQKFVDASEQAIGIWKQSFSVDQTDSMAEADVAIDWETMPPSDGALARPLVHMGDNRKIRTIIVVNLQPFRGQPAGHQLHAALHELGHAFGLWGHSDDPNDVMYPSQRAVAKDIPLKWSRRSASTVMKASGESGDFSMIRLKPSQRDINTLLRIYDEPALDLSTYNPYF